MISTRDDLTARIEQALDITRDAATDLTDVYIRQVSDIEPIDPDAITDDQADFIVESARRGAEQDTADDQAIDELMHLSEQIRALDVDRDDRAAKRADLIRRLVARGVSVATLASASGLNRSRIYQLAGH